MNYLDIFLSILLIIGLIHGFKRGLIIEVSSLAGLLLGIYGAIFFSDYLSDILKAYVSWDKSMLQLVSFAGTFLIILIGVGLIGKILTKIAKSIALGFFNKLAGGIFGLFKIALILSIILLIFDKFNKSLPFVQEVSVADSKLYKPVRDFSEKVFPGLVKMANEKASGTPDKKEK
jgi:membrane protein required for colicin V production